MSFRSTHRLLVAVTSDKKKRIQDPGKVDQLILLGINSSHLSLGLIEDGNIAPYCPYYYCLYDAPL